MVKIYDDDELRQKVALEKAKADTVEDVMKDKKKKKIFYKWMDSSQVKMYGKKVGDKWVKGIEDFIPNEQYQTDIQSWWKVPCDICDIQYSRSGTILAAYEKRNA